MLKMLTKSNKKVALFYKKKLKQNLATFYIAYI